MSTIHVYHHSGEGHTPSAPIGDMIDFIKRVHRNYKKEQKRKKDIAEFDAWLADCDKKIAAKKEAKAAKALARKQTFKNLFKKSK